MMPGDVLPRTPDPDRSWWCDWTNFYAICQGQQERMQGSRFGQTQGMTHGENERRRETVTPWAVSA